MSKWNQVFLYLKKKKSFSHQKNMNFCTKINTYNPGLTIKETYARE